MNLEAPDGGDRRGLGDRREALDEDAKLERKSRLITGGVSALPIAIIVSWGYNELVGHQMDQSVAMAIASLMGSMFTGMVLCYKDMRAVICTLILKRRHAIRRRAK